MVLRYCPNCQQPFCVSPNSGDFVHTCNSESEDLDKEDVKVIGTWEDYTGSGGQPSMAALKAGMSNTLMGVQGSDKIFLDEKTIFGNNASTHKQRRRLQYIDSSNFK